MKNYMNDLAIMEMIKTNLKNKHATGSQAKCMALKKQKNHNDNKESSSEELDIYGGKAKENGKNHHKGKETDSDKDMDNQRNTLDDNRNHEDDQNCCQHNQNPNPSDDNRNHKDNQNCCQHNQSSDSMDDEQNPQDDNRNHKDNQSHRQPNRSPESTDDERMMMRTISWPPRIKNASIMVCRKQKGGVVEGRKTDKIKVFLFLI